MRRTAKKMEEISFLWFVFAYQFYLRVGFFRIAKVKEKVPTSHGMYSIFIGLVDLIAFNCDRAKYMFVYQKMER